MARDVPPEYARASQEHLRQLNRLIDRTGLVPLRKLYNEAQADLVRKLARLGRGKTFTAHQHRMFLAQIKEAQLALSKRMSAAMGQISQQTQVDTLRKLITSVKKLEKGFSGAAVPLPIEEAARFWGVIDKRRSSLLTMHKTSWARYGSTVVREMEKQLAVSLATGESALEAIDRVQSVSESEWWQAERVVRTEQAFAVSAATADAIAETAKELPDMMMRWTEHVNDATGKPLPESGGRLLQGVMTRVGADSVAMHGQVAAPGELFTMPPTPGVSVSLWNQQWAHPPNRPNDRGVLRPWRLHWGVPGWVWKGGRKVWLVK